MNEQLSAFKIKQGRRIYDIYNIINSLSFTLVTGNTITLYALLLQANTTEVGLLTAFMYLSYFAIPLGKLMVNRFTIMQTFGYTWLLRNISLLPMLAMPFLVSAGAARAALYCLLIAVGLFNFFRGMGMISFNPVIKNLAPGKDRGSYIVRVALISNIATLFASLALALLLSWDASITTYNIAAIAGIVLGVISSFLLFKIPEPHVSPDDETGTSSNKQYVHKISFFVRIKDAFIDANFRRFIVVFFIINLGIAMVRPFIIVYAKEVYSQQDNMVTILSVFSVIGALFVGFILKLVIDRIGAKPLYAIFTAISAVSLLPALAAPGLTHNGIFALVFLLLFSTVSNMGFTGQDNASQAYFFAMVPEDAIMDLSMLYYFILGITGGIGSILGGIILDTLRFYGCNFLQSYQIFFVGTVVIIIVGMLFQNGLLNLGSYRIFETLAVLFSPRDMRALNLLHKLDVNESFEKEQKIISALGEIGSTVSSNELLHYLESPRLSIRLNALNALYSMDTLNQKVREVLLKEVSTGVFTTAPLAVKVLRKFHVVQALPALRTALDSDDYYLVGEAMLALAELDDSQSQLKIGTMLSVAENPALLLKGIQAMDMYGSVTSIPFILDILRRVDLDSLIEYEALLALASLMGIQNNFYYVFEKYINEKKSPVILVLDALEEAFEIRKKTDNELKTLTTHFIQSADYDTAFVHWIIEFGNDALGVRSALLLGVALDIDLIHREAFRFFLSFWVACLFKEPALLEA